MGLHVGVLGTGGWCSVHLAALAASPHVGRVTLAGRNATALAELAAGNPIVAATTADYRHVLDDKSVDVVHVVLPHHLHAERTKAALAAGKHVVCEKPAAMNLADFDASVAAAQANGRRLLVVLNQLYNPVYGRLRELAAAGAIGRVFLSVENSYSSARTFYLDPNYWRTSIAESGGGVLIDGGFHMVYRHLDTLAPIGSPTWVLADTPQLAVTADGATNHTKGEDFVSLTVGFPMPLRIQWAHGWTLAAPPGRARQSFLAGTDGTLELTDDPTQPLTLCRAEGQTPIAVDPGPRSGRETTHACLVDYLDCIATGREPTRASLTLARLTLATILAAYRSGQSGRRETIGS